MIKRVHDEETANICDTLLTLLISDEHQYDKACGNIVVKDYFKTVINNDKNILLVNEDDIVNGYIFLKYINDETYLIDGLFVLEEYRNKGIAKKLLIIAINLLSEKQVKNIEIKVMYNNEIARNLYKKFGFNELSLTMKKMI